MTGTSDAPATSPVGALHGPVDHRLRSARNAFAALDLDRVGLRRRDPAWVAARLIDPESRFLPVWGDRVAVTPGPRPAALLWEPAALSAAVLNESVLLGEDGLRTYFAIDLPEPLPAGGAGDARLVDLRDTAAELGAHDAALFAYARAMVGWHRRHRHCGVCGAATRSEEAGHVRICAGPACAARHFPRTDPAIIVLVVHRDGSGEERCLLGRAPGWPPRRYSTLAGFVEPGESLEAAVAREVEEEAGVRVSAVSYHSSQPWPFPGSLMVGFTAAARDTRIERRDGELEDARWLSRAEIRAGIEDGSLHLPRRVSISFRLIEDWFDAGSVGPLAGYLPPST